MITLDQIAADAAKHPNMRLSAYIAKLKQREMTARLQEENRIAAEMDRLSVEALRLVGMVR